MLLPCLGGLVFSMSIVASSSSKINWAEPSRAQRHRFDSQEPSAKGYQIGTLSDRSEDSKNIVRRAVRRFPEESEGILIGHRQALNSPETTCICPDLLTRGTVVAIIVCLAFFGLFSILILLLVTFIVVRVSDRKWDKEKKQRGLLSRPLPPIPRRPSEPIYMVPKATSVYKQFHPAKQSTDSMYIDPKELHPGPRVREAGKYSSPSGTGAEPKSTPENVYTNMQRERASPVRSPENVYASIRRSEPLKTYSNVEPESESIHSPENVYASTRRSEPLKTYSNVEPESESIHSPENVYASTRRSEPVKTYSNVEPESESMAEASLNTEEQSKGPEEHIYEEID